MNRQKIKDSFINTWNTFKVLGGESFIDYIENIHETKVNIHVYFILNNFEFNTNKYGSCYAYQLLFNNYPLHILEEISTRYF